MGSIQRLTLVINADIVKKEVAPVKSVELLSVVVANSDMVAIKLEELLLYLKYQHEIIVPQEFLCKEWIATWKQLIAENTIIVVECIPADTKFMWDFGLYSILNAYASPHLSDWCVGHFRDVILPSLKKANVRLWNWEISMFEYSNNNATKSRLFIATSQLYRIRGIYAIGGDANLDRKLAYLNYGRAEDIMYYVYTSPEIDRDRSTYCLNQLTCKMRHLKSRADFFIMTENHLKEAINMIIKILAN